MINNELNIVTIIGPHSESVLDEIKTNISHDIDEFGTYFIISNKYYHAKIHFTIINSYNILDISRDSQAIIITSKADEAKNLISKFKNFSNPLKFLWVIDSPSSSSSSTTDELVDLCLEHAIELLISNKLSTNDNFSTSLNATNEKDANSSLDASNDTLSNGSNSNKFCTFQVPLLMDDATDNASLCLFRSLECHKWINSTELLKDDMSLDRAIEIVKEAREINLKSDDISDRVSRATKAIMDLKSLLY